MVRVNPELFVKGAGQEAIVDARTGGSAPAKLYGVDPPVLASTIASCPSRKRTNERSHSISIGPTDLVPFLPSPRQRRPGPSRHPSHFHVPRVHPLQVIMKKDASDPGKRYQKAQWGSQERVWAEFETSPAESKEFTDRVFPPMLAW